jgi:hypothetical protein
MFCQLTAAYVVSMLVAVMETCNGSRHSHHLLHPPVAAAPASGASRSGCAGGTRRLDDLGLRTRRRRHSHLPALSPRAGLAGHVERSRHVDRCPRATQRQAVRLNRWPPRPQQSRPAMPLMRPPGPGLVWVWLGLLVGTLVLAWPGVLAAWPAVDRPRTSRPEAVSPLLDDRDLEDDRPSALTRRTTALGLPPATIGPRGDHTHSLLALPLSDEAPIAHPPLTPPRGEGPPDLHPTRWDRINGENDSRCCVNGWTRWRPRSGRCHPRIRLCADPRVGARPSPRRSYARASSPMAARADARFIATGSWTGGHDQSLVDPPAGVLPGLAGSTLPVIPAGAVAPDAIDAAADDLMLLPRAEGICAALLAPQGKRNSGNCR